jgi:4-amino-4-deoxy-L-arabinose transferase-like glycosyltransferase
MIKFNKAHLLIGLVLLAGFLFRFISLNWGLPLKKAHVDESAVIFYSMRFLTGDLNPRVFFDYPTLFLYILSGLFYAGFAVGKILGAFKSLDQFAGIFLNGDASYIYMIARSASALLGTASVYLVYRIAREASFKYAAAGALLFAVFPLHVLHSHYATVDIAAVFFVLLSFLFLGRYLSDKNRLAELYKGSFVLGLAAATKYYPAVFFLPLAIQIFVREGGAKLKVSAVSFGLLAAGFIVGCPFSLLDFSSFFSRFIDRFGLIIWSGRTAANPGPGWALPAATVQAFTLPLLAFLATGTALSLAFYGSAGRKNLLAWLSFPAALLIFLGAWKIVSPHYLMALVPFACFIGLDGYGRLAQKIPKYLVYLLIAGFCVSPFLRSVRIDKALAIEDTRLTSYKWIKQNIPPGSRILRLAYTPEFTKADPFFVYADWENKLVGSPVEEIADKFDYVITSRAENSGPSGWEQKLQKNYKITKQWDGIAFAQFHHPEITIYGKKT